MRTMIEHKKDGTVWGYIEPLNMWMEFESDDAYYDYLENLEVKED